MMVLSSSIDIQEADVLHSIYLYIWIFAFNAYLAVFISFLFAERNRLVNKVTILVGLGTVWILAELSMRMGVAPSSGMWLEISEIALMVIPYVMYMAICSVTGRNLFSMTSVLLGIFCFMEVALGVLGLYYNPEFILEQVGSGGLYAIDNIYIVRTHPTVFTLVIVLGNTITTILSLKEILSSSRIGCRNLLILNIVFYYILMTGNIYLSSYFPFDLVAGMVNAFMFMYYLKQKKILNFNRNISHKSFPVLSTLTVVIFLLLLRCKAWGRMEPLRGSILSLVLVSSATTSLITLLFESLYSRFFVDRGDYILKCSAYYHESLIPLLGKVDDIADLFRNTMEKIYDCTHMALFIYDEKERRYTIRGDSRFKEISFEENHPLCEHVALLKSPQSAWNILQYLGDRESVMAEAIEDRNLSVFSPLQLNGRVVGFYLIGGGRISTVDAMDRNFISSFNRTTAMAIESSILMHQLEKSAVTDVLTGLYDRNTVKGIINAMINTREDFSFLLFNIDDLKLYNTVYSLNTGNDILKAFADAMKKEAEKDYVLGRVSGKTFSAFIPGNKERAIEFDRRVRIAFTEANKGTERSSVTFSTGLVYVKGNEDNNAEWLLNAAKDAEILAKKRGKDRLCEYTADLVDEFHGFDSGFQIGTVEAISHALNLRDHFTYDHSNNVAGYARSLAVEIGLDPIECQIIYEAGLVHDIGKISIPDDILLNPGPLTDEEYEIMKTHVERGRNVIESLPHGNMMVPIAMTHHERWDGKGYPKGLKGDEIPIGGRCLAIADTFDAMISKRIYRKPFSVEDSLKEIERCSGSQFDPELGPLFVSLVRSGKIIPHPCH